MWENSHVGIRIIRMCSQKLTELSEEEMFQIGIIFSHLKCSFKCETILNGFVK